MLNVLCTDSYVSWEAGALIKDILSVPFRDLAHEIRKWNFYRADVGVINSESMSFHMELIMALSQQEYSEQLIDAIKNCPIREAQVYGFERVEIPKRAKFFGAGGWGESALERYFPNNRLNYVSTTRPNSFLVFRFFNQ